MRQLTLVGPGKLEWWDVPERRLEGPEEALVRPLAAGRCDFDVTMIQGHPLFPAPFAFGHECVGEVTAVGEAVRRIQVGDLVVVPFQISCGTCAACRMQISAGCTAHTPKALYGHTTRGLFGVDAPWGGALSDSVRIPHADAMLTRADPRLDPAQLASLSDNLSDAWRCVGPYAHRYSDLSVLIVAGRSASIGLYAVHIARALGVAQVDYFDTDSKRLDHAAALGANPLSGPLPERLGSHRVTVNTSGLQEGLACALRSTAPGGVCTSTIVVGGGDAAIPLQEMYLKNVTLKTGFINAASEIPVVLDLIERGVLQPERVTTTLAAWEDAAEAFLEEGSKVIVKRA
ncbi:MAG: alcohol dehydrogenase catalytic domain-containing protein [Proteobacteria bacterium]|nr:alcohol dehydrogenase catalytic domain-containing protein [Pseudomonadota bacterium]